MHRSIVRSHLPSTFGVESRTSSGQPWFPLRGPGRASRELAWLYTSSRASSQQTTPFTKPSVEWVTVTHPHHPLHGQRVRLIRVRRGPDPDLLIRMPEGYHGAIAANLTDYAGPVDPYLCVVALPLLSIEWL